MTRRLRLSQKQSIKFTPGPMRPPHMVDLPYVDLYAGKMKNGCPNCRFRPFGEIKDPNNMEDVRALYCSGCNTQFNFTGQKPNRFAGLRRR